MGGELEAEFNKRRDEANAPLGASDELAAAVAEMVRTGAGTCAESIHAAVLADPRLAGALTPVPAVLSEGNFDLKFTGTSFDVRVDGQVSYNRSKAIFDRPEAPGWTSFEISATVTASTKTAESASERIDAHFQSDGSVEVIVAPAIEAALVDLAHR
jgi:hypothetical protein